MTRTMIAFVSTVALVLASSVTVPAQGKKGSTPKPQHVSSKGTTKVSSPKTTQGGPKTSGPKTVSQTSKGPKTTTVKATGKTKTTSSPATKSARADAKTTTKSVKADTKATKNEKTATTTTATTTTPTSGDTETPPVVLSRVQERLNKNTKLADRLEGRLPKGMDLMEAAEGFTNLGRFVAAVNVSSNLRLDFEKLKIAMIEDGKSLGQAIQVVKKDVENPTLVAQRAEAEAQTLIQQTENTATTNTTTTSTTQKPKSKATTKRNGSGS